MAFWLVIGTPENWKHSLEHGNIWGFPQHYEAKWSEMQVGDTIVYYAMRPIKRLIGYGTVESKMRSEQPFFPSEMELKRLVWPLQIRFKDIRSLEVEKWQTEGQVLERRGVVFQRALQKLEERKGLDLVCSLSGRQH